MLEAKKLVVMVQRDGRAYYQAQPPDSLRLLAEAQLVAAAHTREAFEQLLPDLKSHYAMSVGKPTVQYYEGEKGLQTVFTDIYAKKTTPVYGCVDLEKTEAVFPTQVLKELIPLRIKNKLFAYSLLADSPAARKTHQEDVSHLRSSVLVDKQDYPLPAEIDVYEDKIALLSFEAGSFIGIVIQNEAFATTLKSIFKLALQIPINPKPTPSEANLTTKITSPTTFYTNRKSI